MSSVVLLLVSIAVFIIAYATYGSYLAKSWGIDPKKPTPAHEMEDGVDYVPANKAVLLGHHFSSIAGAGPINGPIQAAVFGWVPVLLWIVLGGIFFGAVQDFSALFASIRHKGKSLGEIIEINISHRTKMCFTVFAWLVLILVVAAFADIVAGTFAGFNADGDQVPANGSVATASLLFIPLAVAFGLFNRKSSHLGINTVVGVALLIACIAIGIACPVFLPKSTWLIVVFIYIFIFIYILIFIFQKWILIVLSLHVVEFDILVFFAHELLQESFEILVKILVSVVLHISHNSITLKKQLNSLSFCSFFCYNNFCFVIEL